MFRGVIAGSLGLIVLYVVVQDEASKRLTGAAGLSVLAHLEDMVARGVIETDGAPAIGGVYRLAG